ncbi:hypothetical protein PIB30_026938 [Stylosanthes scabra]|uniref:CCHC-type domain-containing protein n=1 Tax=Stylosanthes scabra TaxID=79078 RepID=A0ABU6YAQ3_9FABA|nr:hypothetical protein [Stylosanthes scabra]
MEKNMRDSRGLQRLSTPLFTTHTGGILASIWRPTIISDPRMTKARVGRPRTTQIRTNMDDVDPNRPKHCRLCRQVGHTKKNCDQRSFTSDDGV